MNVSCNISNNYIPHCHGQRVSELQRQYEAYMNDPRRIEVMNAANRYMESRETFYTPDFEKQVIRDPFENDHYLIHCKWMLDNIMKDYPLLVSTNTR